MIFALKQFSEPWTFYRKKKIYHENRTWINFQSLFVPHTGNLCSNMLSWIIWSYSSSFRFWFCHCFIFLLVLYSMNAYGRVFFWHPKHFSNWKTMYNQCDCSSNYIRNRNKIKSILQAFFSSTCCNIIGKFSIHWIVYCFIACRVCICTQILVFSLFLALKVLILWMAAALFKAIT